MASSTRSQQHQSPRVYAFTITLLKVTRIPSPMRLSFSASSSLRMIPSRRTLKITVLHGSKQKELGEYEVVQDECLIDQRISCRLFCAKDDDLGKLHIYIDQAHSSGLAGHVALDLKEFLEDMDSELYIKYPLSASSPREGYVPKLKMTLECTCLGNPENLFIPDLDTIIHHKRRIPTALLTDSFAIEGDTSNEPHDGSSEHCPEMQLLEELETVLFKLDTKLKNFVATCKTDDEKDIPVDTSTVLKRPLLEDNGEDCSDCIVCSKGALDKFQGISSGLLLDKEMAAKENEVVVESAVAEEKDEARAGSEGSVGGEVELQKPGNHPAGVVLRNLVGGAIVVGVSLFAANRMRRRRDSESCNSVDSSRSSASPSWPELVRRRLRRG